MGKVVANSISKGNRKSTFKKGDIVTEKDVMHYSELVSKGLIEEEKQPVKKPKE